MQINTSSDDKDRKKINIPHKNINNEFLTNMIFFDDAKIFSEITIKR